MNYRYKAEVVGVYDADTITANIDLGFHVWFENQKIRLLGIDAPELRGSEREKGIVARNALSRLILAQSVTLETVKDRKGKYGRWLATVFYDGLNVNEWLVEKGYAKRSD